MGHTTLERAALGALISGELKRRGLEAKFIGEIATQDREKGFPINENTTIEAQLLILDTQFAEELALGSERNDLPNYEVLVCDRRPKNYCYLEHSLGKNTHALSMTLNHLT